MNWNVDIFPSFEEEWATPIKQWDATSNSARPGAQRKRDSAQPQEKSNACCEKPYDLPGCALY